MEEEEDKVEEEEEDKVVVCVGWWVGGMHTNRPEGTGSAHMKPRWPAEKPNK